MKFFRANGWLRALLCGLIAAVALGFVSPTAQAQNGHKGWSYELWDELMSPYCPGRSLADCPSGDAEQLRTWIVRQEEAGRSRSEVEAELFETFGDVLRAAPRPHGVGLAAYLIPIFGFLVGGGVVAFFLRRQGRGSERASTVAAGEQPVDPELERLVDEELRNG